MANEYLKRTPTSTGNRKKWTLSLWLKRNAVFGDTGADVIFNAANTATNSHGTDIRFRKDNSNGNNNGWNFYDYVNNSFPWVKYGDTERRDSGNWFHAMFVFDSTKPRGDDRVEVYINGVLDTAIMSSYDTNPSQNYESYVNSITEHYLGIDQFGGSLTTSYSKSQFSDVFLVDGQALTADVFGFYKDGKGYQSSGTTQATDFRPGQWSPHSPRKIKTEIERKGGFGVNGFYLPMNDSSNFGADFHCAPNSIIKLKGEDLPQPRNGAPTTSDAYVSELREDPYAANLVLAVPGISTATGSNLVTNGNFDSNVSGWSVAGGTFTWNNGRAQHVTTSNTPIWQQLTGLTIGQRYTFQYIHYSGYTSAYISTSTVSSGSILPLGDAVGSSTIVKRGSFTATATSYYVVIYGIGNRTSIWDDVVVKQEDAPRDYSADIKGSGTNKTLTANGNAGVGYELGNYYGSAMTFDGNGDYIRTTSNLSDFHFGTGDFTIEAWIWKSANGSQNYDGLISLGTNGSATDGFFFEISATRGYFFAANGNFISYNSSPNTSQWNHVVAERYNGRSTIYLNGVAVATGTNIGSIPTNGTVLDIGAYGLDGVGGEYYFNGYIQDVRVYKGVAKYKGGFDVPKPYSPIGIESWRQVSDTCKNNFATLNPLGSGAGTFTDGNLTYNSSSDTGNASIGISTGNFYCEARVANASPANGYIGVMEATEQNPLRGGGWVSHGGIAYKQNGDQYFKAKGSGTSSSTSFGNSYTTGDIIGVACDVTNNTVTFYKNGVSQGTTSQGPSSIQSSGTFTALFYGNTVEWNINFGQNPSFSGNTSAGTYTDANGRGLFKYQPPSGFLALCEDNLPTPAIADPGEHFKCVLWTGDDSDSMKITGVGFKPDLVWVKKRSGGSQNHTLYDSVRGADKRLMPNVTNAESSVTDHIRSFDNDGFSIGGNNFVNDVGKNYVAWCWKTGGATVSNTDGSINSQVSVNQTAGFSIVSYTGNATESTVGHGLNKTPGFILLKKRNGASDWPVYHHSLLTQEHLVLNKTDAKASSTELWYQDPTSSVFYIGDASNAINASGGTYIAYCWAEIEGYSKFGSYMGNASADGTFVYCGFKPAFVITKRTDGNSNWLIHDSSRDSVNPVMGALYANSSDVEGRGSVRVDFVSNGFKHRNADGGAANNYANDYIFMAFAESPFQNANAK